MHATTAPRYHFFLEGNDARGFQRIPLKLGANCIGRNFVVDPELTTEFAGHAQFPEGADSVVHLESPNNAVSRRHALVTTTAAGEAWVRDQNSTNGTRIVQRGDGSGVPPMCLSVGFQLEPMNYYQLLHGGWVSFGDVEMKLVVLDAETGFPAMPSQDDYARAARIFDFNCNNTPWAPPTHGGIAVSPQQAQQQQQQQVLNVAPPPAPQMTTTTTAGVRPATAEDGDGSSAEDTMSSAAAATKRGSAGGKQAAAAVAAGSGKKSSPAPKRKPAAPQPGSRIRSRHDEEEEGGAEDDGEMNEKPAGGVSRPQSPPAAQTANAARRNSGGGSPPTTPAGTAASAAAAATAAAAAAARSSPTSKDPVVEALVDTVTLATFPRPLVVCFTGMLPSDKKKVQPRIEAAGGSVCDNWDNSVTLLCTKASPADRTPKLMMAVGRGVPVVTMEFFPPASASKVERERRTLLACSPSIHAQERDGDFLVVQPQQLLSTLRRNSRYGPVLRGRSIDIAGLGEERMREQVTEIVEALGGQIVAAAGKKKSKAAAAKAAANEGDLIQLTVERMDSFYASLLTQAARPTE